MRVKADQYQILLMEHEQKVRGHEDRCNACHPIPGGHEWDFCTCTVKPCGNEDRHLPHHHTHDMRCCRCPGQPVQLIGTRL